MNVAASDAVVVLVSCGTRTGILKWLALDDYGVFDDMFWTVCTIFVLALYVPWCSVHILAIEISAQQWLLRLFPQPYSQISL